MFIIIPIILILASFAGIAVIVLRKRVFLRKLSLEHHKVGDNLFNEFFPEITDKAKSINWKEYKEIGYMELEKILRRLRLVSLKIDRFSDSLIKKVRHATNEVKIEAAAEEKKEEEKIQAKNPPAIEKPVNTMDAMKKEEQRLIIEIAKNPKDGGLYKTLSDLYLKMNNFQDAKESLEAALELEPENEGLKRKHSQIIEKLAKLEPKNEPSK